MTNVFAVGDSGNLDYWRTYSGIYADGGVAVGFVAAVITTGGLASSTDIKFLEAVKESAVTTTAILIIIAAAKDLGKGSHSIVSRKTFLPSLR